MSKGSRPRPYSVSLDTFGSNFDSIFRKQTTKENTMTDTQPNKQTKSCGCGRSPTGNCNGWHALSESEFAKRLAEYKETSK